MSRKNLVLKIYELSRNYVTTDKAAQEACCRQNSHTVGPNYETSALTLTSPMR